MSLRPEDLKKESYRFGPFELRPRLGEFRKHGVRLRLQEQPLQILLLLLARRGDLVSREEIQSTLWPDNVSVEFDHAINAAVRRLREVLGDSAEEPRYVETVARRGYRFLVTVEPDVAVVPADAKVAPAPPTAPEALPQRHTGRTTLLLLAALSAIVAAAAVWIRNAPPPPLPVSLAPPANGRIVGVPALAPDGKHLVAAVEDAAQGRSLWLHSLESGNSQFLPGTTGALSPFWSPDGTSIAFFSGTELKVILVGRGQVRRICGAVGAAAGAWNQDSIILYTTGPHMPLFRVRANGGSKIEPATSLLEGEALGHASPQFLPDGRHFLFLAPHADPHQSTVFLASLDSSDRQPLLTNATQIVFTAPDQLLFLREGALLAQRLDLARLQLRGAPQAVSAGKNALRAMAFSAAAHQLVVLEARPGAIHDSLTWRDRNGKAIGYGGRQGAYWQVSLAPNDQIAAVNLPQIAPLSHLALLQVQTAGWSDLNSDPRHVLDAVWSPDSKNVVYQVYGAQKTQIIRQRLGESSWTVLLDDGLSNYPDDWSPDGKWILCRRSGNTVFTLPANGGSPHILLEGEHILDQLRFSPDGKWVAYNSDESGRWEVYVARFPQMDRPRKLSTDGGCQPLWRRDGKELFYLRPDGKLFALSLDAASAAPLNPPQPLFPSRVPVNCGISQYGVTADGSRFLLIEEQTQPRTGMRVFSNWTLQADAR